ncbi:hypothetical protein D9M71_424390 [compost metagenome]
MHDVQASIRPGHLDEHPSRGVQHFQRATDDVAACATVDHRVGVRRKHTDDDAVRPVGRELARAGRHTDRIADELVRRSRGRPGEVGGHGQFQAGRAAGACPYLRNVEPVDVGRVARQISAWRVNRERCIGSEGDQRGFANLDLGQRYLVLALADVQQHFHALVTRRNVRPTWLCQVRRIDPLVAGDLPHRFAQLDLVALGAGLGQWVALLGAGAGWHAGHLGHDGLQHRLGAFEQREGDGKRVCALRLAVDLQQVGRLELHLVPKVLVDQLVI